MMSKTRKVAIEVLFGISALLLFAYIPCAIWIVDLETDLKGYATAFFALCLLIPAGVFGFIGAYLLSGGKVRLSHKATVRKIANRYSDRILRGH